MSEREKTMLAWELSSPSQRLDNNRPEGWGLTSLTRNCQRKDDPEIEDHLLDTFRSIVDTAMVDLRKEDMAKGFMKVEEGR
jgi:hypothetical protein